jgi:CHAD domain-containing protein
MRVATRRLRAVLEIYEPCFSRKQLRDVLDDVKALADALGERRDPDVQLSQLDEFAAAVKPADRPGVELFAERVRSEQGSANEELAGAIAELEETDLRGRLASLAASAEERGE